MIASLGLLSIMVTMAVIVTAIAPIILLALFVKDWRKGEQW